MPDAAASCPWDLGCGTRGVRQRQAQVMALWLRWLPGHDLCLRLPPAPPPPRPLFQNVGKKNLWNGSYQKKFKSDFFGRWKMFVMSGVGPRPACHIPDPRDSWQQRTLWFSHVIVSRAANPALQWYLKIEFCCLESEIAFRDLIFASLEPQECIFTILHSFLSKFGMF